MKAVQTFLLGILLVGPIGYSAYWRFFRPMETDPVSQWLFVEHRSLSIAASCLLAALALSLAFMRRREQGKRRQISYFLLVALSISIAIIFTTGALGL